MTVGSALRELGRILDRFERAAAVRAVEIVDPADVDGSGALTADVALTLSTDPSAGTDGTATAVETTVDDDGRLRVAFVSPEGLVPTGTDGAAVTPVGTRLDGGRLRVVLAVSVPTSDGGRAATAAADEEGATAGDRARVAAEPREDDRANDTGDRRRVGEGRSPTERDRGTTTGPGGETETRTERDREPSTVRPGDETTSATTPVPWRDRELPPFRDPDLLADVYDSCETFAEMADALEMDVTAETVRRYMIDFDIHQPNSYDTGGDTDAEVDGDTDAGSEPDTETGGDDGGNAGRSGAAGTDDGSQSAAGGRPGPDPEHGDDPERDGGGRVGMGVDADTNTNTDADADTNTDADANTNADEETETDGAGGVDGEEGTDAGRGRLAEPPASGRTPGGSPESPVVLADGVGLPNDVTVEALVETVKRSHTVHEVTRDVGIEHETAIDMLRELDLLDLVVGRLATEADRDIDRDEVVDRLRAASATR
jgi:hypothetical protein